MSNPWWEDGANKTKGFEFMKTQEQMELELATANRCPRVMQRNQRQNRANWWFGQMRQVVDRAFDWEPAPRFQPEQILLGQKPGRG